MCKMNCKICGSSDFCTTLGITYCGECNSQIESTQTETAVDVFPSKDSAKAVKKTGKSQKQEYSEWITAECFNHILFLQVSALIKLGASHKLKKTVLHIWSRYLQKCEIAFRTDYQAKDGTPHLGPVPKRRDVKVVYGDECKSKRKRRNSERLSSSRITVEGEESNFRDSDPITDTSISSVISVKKKFSSHAKKLYRKSTLKDTNISTYSKKVFNMTVTKTISFCYLGLLYTEDHLALSDLIRFIYEDKIPFLNIADKLPPHLKFDQTDSFTFLKYSVPDASSVHKMAHEIMQFLKLPKYKEPSLFLAVSRFLKDLNLPDDIKPIVKVLFEKYKEKLSTWKDNSTHENVPHDCQALSFIIVALKLLFVLDDRFENEHSATMNKLNTIHPDKRYFVWKEWKEHIIVKEYLFLSENPGYSAINKLDRLSADRIISKYQFTHLKSPTSNDVYDLKWERIQRNEIKNILSDVVSIPDKADIVATSFPLTSETKCFMVEWNTLPMFKETEDIDFTLLEKDFTSCSLHFNPLQFDKDVEELSYLLMTSLYLPETIEGKFDLNFPIADVHHVVTTTSKYWFFNATNFGTSEFSTDWLDKLPSSFTWLINFISKYACTNCVYLYKEIARIEKALLVGKQKIYHNTLSCKNKIHLGF